MVKDADYWDRVRERAKELHSDGCSCVPDFFLYGCLEHDCHYRLHLDMDNNPINKAEADLQLKQYIQSHSWLRRYSPMAQWRYWAVKRFGKKAWDHDA